MSNNKRDSMTDAQLDEALVTLRTDQGCHAVAHSYGMCWDTMRRALVAKRHDAYIVVKDWRICSVRKKHREPRPGIYHHSKRVKRVLTEEELDDSMARLHRFERRDAVAGVLGVGWDQLSKALNERSPLGYKAVMAKRYDAGKKRGGNGSSQQKERIAPAKKGGGFFLHLPGSGLQTMPNGMGNSPRWPVKGLAEFKTDELAEIATKLLGWMRTA